MALRKTRGSAGGRMMPASGYVVVVVVIVIVVIVEVWVYMHV
jgi:hypothetical protein